MSKIERPQDAESWLGVYHSAVQFGREQGYLIGFIQGYADGRTDLHADDEKFAQMVADAMVARIKLGEEISGSVRATLAAIEAEKHR